MVLNGFRILFLNVVFFEWFMSGFGCLGDFGDFIMVCVEKPWVFGKGVVSCCSAWGVRILEWPSWLIVLMRVRTPPRNIHTSIFEVCMFRNIHTSS